MNRLDQRLRAVADLDAAFLREYSGLHEEYDGQIIDLSPAGVAANLNRLGGSALLDQHDEKQLAATENAMRVRFGVVEQHRRDPWVHLEALDLSQYDRPYGPEADRMRARQEHLRHWPEVVDNALASLDLVHSSVAGMFSGAARGIANSIPADDRTSSQARAAATRLADQLATVARDPTHDELYLGEQVLIELLGCEDLLEVDLTALVADAEQETRRLHELLADALAKLGYANDHAAGLEFLRNEHGDFAAVRAHMQDAVDTAATFVRQRELIPIVDDDCVVEESPASRSWGVARVSWRAPWETEGHSFFHVTAPDASWTPAAQRSWLRRFNRSSASVIAVHEVAPGHCSHARAMATMTSPVRKTLWSELFFEGWAHYAEEMCWEQGYLADDPRYQAGMAMDALLRVTRVKCAIGLHTGALSMAEAVKLFTDEGYVEGPMAQAEAARGAWEPTYIRYTWGKMLMKQLRLRAMDQWGSAFTLQRFHRELLSYGSPPVGLVAEAMGL